MSKHHRFEAPVGNPHLRKYVQKPEKVQKFAKISPKAKIMTYKENSKNQMLEGKENQKTLL